MMVVMMGCRGEGFRKTGGVLAGGGVISRLTVKDCDLVFH